MPVSELRARLGIRELPEEDRGRYNTVAGLLLFVSGQLPEVGERIDCAGFAPGWTVTVTGAAEAGTGAACGSAGASGELAVSAGAAVDGSTSDSAAASSVAAVAGSGASACGFAGASGIAASSWGAGANADAAARSSRTA